MQLFKGGTDAFLTIRAMTMLPMTPAREHLYRRDEMEGICSCYGCRVAPRNYLGPRWLNTAPHSQSTVFKPRRFKPPCASATFQAGTSIPLWPHWSILATISALSHVVSNRTPAGKALSGPLLATLFGVAAVSVGLLPAWAPQYDIIWNFLTPLAAALYLLESDISDVFTTSRAMMLAFLNGAIGTVLGTFVAFAFVGNMLGPDGAKVASALCASYIGGSINFATVSGLLGFTSGSSLTGAMAADNFAMAVYIAIITAIPCELTSHLPSASTEDVDTVAEARVSMRTLPVTTESLILSIAAGVVACALGESTSTWLGFSSGTLAFTAVFAAIIASVVFKASNIIRGYLSDPLKGIYFGGAQRLGGALMLFIFVTIGAAAGGFHALLSSGPLMVFISIQLGVQLIFTLSMGALMRIQVPVTLIAANANVGGPATAAAMAASKGWRTLVEPSLLVGSFGYAIANGVGLMMYTFLR